MASLVGLHNTHGIDVEYFDPGEQGSFPRRRMKAYQEQKLWNTAFFLPPTKSF
jgi:hypothetical protein